MARPWLHLLFPWPQDLWVDVSGLCLRSTIMCHTADTSHMFALPIRVGTGLGANVQSRHLLYAPCLQKTSLLSVQEVENSLPRTIFSSIRFVKHIKGRGHKGPQEAILVSVTGKADLHLGNRGAVETFPWGPEERDGAGSGRRSSLGGKLQSCDLIRFHSLFALNWVFSVEYTDQNKKGRWRPWSAFVLSHLWFLLFCAERLSRPVFCLLDCLPYTCL